MPVSTLGGLRQLPSLEALVFVGQHYGALTGYDASYNELLRVTGGRVDPDLPAHRMCLLKWLNSWGCRQFKVADHPLASEELAAWYAEHRSLLPDAQQELVGCSTHSIVRLSMAYDTLRLRTACYQVRSGQRICTTFGPTGASKVLFALRPTIAIPWDFPERQALGFGDSAIGYQAYLLHAQDILHRAQTRCRWYGINLSDLPRLLCRLTCTPAKLVDEYYWMVITKGIELPPQAELERWFSNIVAGT